MPQSARRSGARVLDAREMQRLDRNAADLGVPVERLMDNAGRALAKELERQAKGRPVLLLCGKGNNGGDGFAAARHLLQEGHEVQVVLAEPAARIASGAARSHFDRLPASVRAVWRGGRGLERFDVIADCLLGSGLAGAPLAPYAQVLAWLERRRRAGARIVACDVPSGLGTPAAVRPRSTVTFHARKPGMAPANCGRIVVAPIGIPPAASHIGLGDLAAAYVAPRADSHKGQNGVVLVVGGSIPLAGAPAYVAAGAQRMGADLVHVVTPADAAVPMRAWGPGPIVHDGNPGPHLREEAATVAEGLLARCSAVVLGPGLGPSKSARKAARRILDLAADAGLPIVIDADGLDAVTDELLARHGSRIVLTPHAREFQDLAGRAATRRNVVAYAQRNGVTVLRKGAVDVVSDGERTRECHRGHPTLTVGGTGDVLAGVVAALLAKGAAPFDAACAASYTVKAAGEVAARLRSYGADARDVADAVPDVLLRLDAL